MRKRFHSQLLLFLLFVTGVASAQVGPAPQPSKPPAEEKPPLPKYLELRTNVGTGGQPTEAGLRILAERGYKSIVSLRTAEEMAAIPYEEKLAGELGLKYFNIPFKGQEPRESQVYAFNQLMDALKDEKVFVHCTVANRVGAFMMIRLALREGMDTEKAEAEAEKIGLYTDVLRQFARQVIDHHRPGAAPR